MNCLINLDLYLICNNLCFRQDYYGGSHATNLNLGHGRYGRSLRSKRSPQFFQSFAPGSQHVNCLNGGCYQTQQVYRVPMRVPMLPGPFPVNSYVAGSHAILNPGHHRILYPGPHQILYPGPQWIFNPGPHPIFNPAPQPILNPAAQKILNPAPQTILNPAPQTIVNPVPQPILNPAPQLVLSPEPQPILNPAPQDSLEDQAAGDTAAIKRIQGN